MYKIAFLALLLIPGYCQGQEIAESVSLGNVGTASTAVAEQGNSSFPSQPTPLESREDEESRWFGRIGVVGAIYHSGATFSTGGAIIPGGSAVVSNNVSVTFDIGYDITNKISAQLMAGIPPKPTITGEGTVTALGELGAVRYGPAILSGLYKVHPFRAFQPYVGAGAAYAIILKDHQASVSDLHVRNNFGFVLQWGAEYQVARKWSVFADFKEIWLAVDAHGLIGPAPVTAHVKLNPTLVSAGFKYRF